ncbi:MAG: purine-binding chemotaxis protein CheW [Geobacteraceae bacterium]|nr:purine-binding chemotaxis protein CheW [Geobacteraceae bacterium]
MERDIQEIKVVCFRLGSETYALDIMRVREIIKPIRLSGLPDAPSFVEGVINLRGSVIPVVDLRKRFGLTEPADGGERRFLITVVARQPLALVVDAVTEVVSLPVRELRPPPALVRVAGYRYLIGVCLVRNSMVFLVNLDAILDPCESDELTLFHDDSDESEGG